MGRRNVSRRPQVFQRLEAREEDLWEEDVGNGCKKWHKSGRERGRRWKEDEKDDTHSVRMQRARRKPHRLAIAGASLTSSAGHATIDRAIDEAQRFGEAGFLAA
eukprot:6923480-Pyramimonas_sp.AAC.1